MPSQLSGNSKSRLSPNSFTALDWNQNHKMLTVAPPPGAELETNAGSSNRGQSGVRVSPKIPRVDAGSQIDDALLGFFASRLAPMRASKDQITSQTRFSMEEADIICFPSIGPTSLEIASLFDMPSPAARGSSFVFQDRLYLQRINLGVV